MSIVTRTGDDGTSGLLYGQRVPKDHPQIETVGAFDELNAAIGMIKPLLGESARDQEIRTQLIQVQKNLIALMGEVVCAEADAARYAASKFEKIAATDVQRLDTAAAALEARGLKFDGWATPGANARAASFDLARSVARRAERRLTSLPAHGRSVRPELQRFVNRLSDLLWLLAREAEQ
ncbi:cob(I)yrinic acid a,c-diamide adenosyltransferase [Opitutus sp. ER46]|uniref:cob(I)yrinic acid a,c-diamide adenosyltransferase n=1 Tax=Opitutus sp. ER46 TaxID=2161864 RepID=UPI000D31D8C8|nr:cob(I)yrinic acid a,c-diamide adenosyltransferase [Opitutus sp. ER46]PTX92502.1 cob(I)yrinic acid a,c-diamide adenosyltransferase [Opitutus sp. ER46]